MYTRALVFGILLAGIATGCGDSASRGNPADAAPVQTASEPIQKVSAQGAAQLIAAIQNKPVLLNVWATWCPPCIAEMPYFVTFHEKYQEKIPLISLSVDDPSTIESAVRPFHNNQKLPFPVYVLTERNPDELSKALKIDFSGAVPTTILYDAKGNVAKFWEGAVTLDELEAATRAL